MKKISMLFFLILVISSTTLYGQDEFDALRKKATELSPTSLISVSVGGDFFINGTFSGFINERIDHFLTRIVYSASGNDQNSNGDSRGSSDLVKLMNQAVKRNIKILRASGEEISVDLDKFYLTGDLSLNPYLRQDDLIIFSKINIETNYIIVDGAVNKRLKFPFVDGDKLSDALLFAHGIDDAYENVEFAEVVRISYDGNYTNIDTVNLSNAASYILQSGDVVRVIGDVLERKDYKVLVVGEVNKTGYVYINRNKTTLREVIERAGGLKETAWLEYAELVRGTTPDKKVLQEIITSSYESNGQAEKEVTEAFKPSLEWERWKMFRTANLYDDHNSIFRLDADLALVAKNKLVDFTNLRDENAAENDFIVEDGDVIYVPEKMDLVYVMGQVANPGQYHYKREFVLKDYIVRAGGYSEAADDETEIYILKGKSYNWVQIDDYVVIEPGDYIWVRKDPARSFNFYLSRISAVTGIIGSIATIVLLVTQLIK